MSVPTSLFNELAFASVHFKLSNFFFRALKEQQNRTLVEATRPGRRENSLNMRQGEMVQPGSGHIAPGDCRQIFVSFQLET